MSTISFVIQFSYFYEWRRPCITPQGRILNCSIWADELHLRCTEVIWIWSSYDLYFGQNLNSLKTICRIKSAGKLELFCKALLYFLCQKNSTEMCDWLLNGSLSLISVQNSIAKLKEHEISSLSRILSRGRVRIERKLDEEKEEEIGVYAIS